MIAADAEVFVSRQEFAYKPLNRFKGFFLWRTMSILLRVCI